MDSGPSFQRFAKSRSRCISCGVSRTQSCVLRGLGQCLNKQKPIRSVKAEWMGFAHLYYRCIACCYPKTAADGFRSASMPPGMQIRVNLLVRRVYRNLIPLTFVVCGRSVMIGSGKTQSYQCFNAASKRLYPNFFSKRMGSYDKRFFQMM